MAEPRINTMDPEAEQELFVFPASFAQERLWFLANLAPESSAYNCHRFLRLRGPLLLDTLREALRLLMDRHETLRTCFGTSRGKPVQIVHASSPWVLRVADLSGLRPADREREALGLAQREAVRPFDLRQAPLLRIHALRLGPEENLLLFSQHHIVTDGWSMGILVQEVSALYEALSQGRPAKLPELAIQYADFAVWQRERFERPAAGRDLDYWRRYLKGAPPVLDLPFDHPRQPEAEGSLAPARPTVPISAAGSQAFLGLLRRCEATPFMGLLAAFQAITSRWTGQDDFLIGTPISGRGLVETEGLIGFFVNMLLLRSRNASGISFQQLLAKVKADVLEAFAHQETPFSKIVEAVRADRVHGSDNLFQVLFALQQQQDLELTSRFPGVESTPLRMRADAAKFDLSLTTITGDRLSVVLDYRSDLFEHPTMVRLADRLTALLEAFVSAPELPLGALPMLGEAERQQVVVEWNDTEQTFPRELTIHEVFAAEASQRHEQVAVVWRDRTLTYGELDHRSRRLAAQLRRLGVTAGTPVAVALERSPDLVVGLLGILAAGGFYVPLDPSYPDQRLEDILRYSEARLILTEPYLWDRMFPLGAGLVFIDAPPEEEEPEPVALTMGAEATAYAMYTSGSTGQPKGVRIPHRAVIRLVKQDRFAHLGEGEVFLQAAPLSFDASTLEIWAPLLNGARLVLYEEDDFSLEGLERAVRSHGVTTLWLTAGLFHQMIEERTEALAGLRQLLAGGDVLLPSQVEKLLRECPGVRLINGYGPTESTTFACCHPVLALPASGRSLPIGRPIANTSVHVLGQALQPAPIGSFGELYIGGDGLASGYLGQPALTAERFLPSPLASRPGERLYRSGDRARWLSDGTLEFSGRLDQQVKIRGYRVEPGEIEAVLSRHPAVGEATVVVREDRPGDKRLVACAVHSGSGNPGGVKADLARTLPEHMLPSALVWLEELPKNANGKVDRQALLAFLDQEQRPAPSEDRSEPLSAVAAVMKEVWADVLGLEEVDIRSSFFDMGGHSLQAMQVISRVRKIFGIELPVRSLFEKDTVSALAAEVDRIRRSELEIQLVPIAPAPRRGAIPLSFAQRRLWFLDELTPGSSAYNVPAAWFLSGHLRFVSFAAAVFEVVRRHEALRTTFQLSRSGPVQVIASAAPLPLPVIDLRRLRPQDREATARELVEADARRPFDLRRGPLLRIAVVRLEEDETLVLANMHHIVSDGWSIGVLGQEITVLEEAFAKGQPSPLPELPVQYADFAIWQREVLAGGVLAAEIRYWKEQLRDAPLVADLPLDRPRGITRSNAGAVRSLRLPPDLAGAFKQLGRRQGATLFMSLLAGLQVLLGRYSRKPDVCVGTPVAGRSHVEVEGLIGFFVNTLVLRARMEDSPSFGDFLRQVRATTLDAHTHQAVPFEELVEALRPERSVAFSPLFQVMFTVQGNPGWGRGLAGLRARAAEIEIRAAKFDLTLSGADLAEGLDLYLSYSTDLFDGTTAVRLLGHLGNLLAAAVADSGRSIAELPLLSEAEQAHLREWNDTRRTYPRDSCIHELFALQARLAPDRVAMVWRDEVVRYGELDLRANRLAHHLRKLGVDEGCRVGIALRRSPTMIVGILAILKAGASYVPLDPSYPDERLSFMANDADLPIILTEAGKRAAISSAAATLVLVDEEQERFAGESGEAPVVSVAPESLAYVLYTSGSTGVPKGVEVTHRNVVRLVHQANYADLGPGETFLQLAPTSFDAATLEIWAPLLQGGRLVLYPEDHVSNEELAKILAAESVSSLWLTAGLFHKIVEERPEVLRPLRQLLAGGDALSPQHVRRFLKEIRNVALINGYGPTENTTFTCCWKLTGSELTDGSVPIGRPISNTLVYILDADLRQLPIGVAGELYAGGDGVARGYLGQPALTAERFVPSPFGGAGGRLYRTGDLARCLADGRIEFLGRTDNQVKVRGFRVEIGEVEAALAEYPLVQNVVVVAREISPGDRQLIAYLVPEPGSAPTPMELSGFLRGFLPEYMIPSFFLLLEAFPLTPNGKVDRQALPEPGRDRSASSAPFVAPRTPVEELLALLWTELLRVEWISVHDNFFELGGHSLLATQLVSRTRSVLDVEVPVRAVFERPTLGSFAHLVEAARRSRSGSQREPLEPADRSQPLPLSFAQQRLWFIDQLEPGNPVYNVPMGVRLLGDLKPSVLERSLAEVVARHEVLRTSYSSVGGQPVQLIAQEVSAGLALVDLGALSGAVREAEARRLARWEAERPFDLAQGPVFRLLLLRRGDNDHILLATLHHIACDAWSVETLRREVTALYSAFRQGRPSPLPSLPLQYADYALWQRRWLEAEAMEVQLAYWKRQLGDDPPALELPTDRPRPVVQTFRGERQPIALSGPLLDGLRLLARRGSVTPFMALLSLFQVLLRRYSWQTDISVGTPISGRSRVEVEGLIGFFLNTLVIRVDLPADVSFLDLLGRVRELTLEAYAHQDLPFERLVDELRPKRSLSRSPLFQVMFVLLHQSPGEQLEPGLSAVSFQPDPGTAKFDLTWSATVAADEISGTIEYSVDLFDGATAQRLSEHLRNLAQGISREPEASLSSLSLLSRSEEHQLLAEWNDAASPLLGEPLVHRLFERQVGRTPDAVAAVFGGREMSYSELDRLADLRARQLRRLGVGPEVRVGLAVERGLDMAVGVLAVLKAGAAYVPIDPDYPRERRSFMLRDAGAPVLLSQRGLAEDMGDEGLQVVCLDSAPSDQDGTAGLEAQLCGDHLAYVIYTSGSTGTPKGVGLPHRSLYNLITWHVETLCVGARTLQFASLSFDASFHEMLACWASGGTLCIVDRDTRKDIPVLAEMLIEQRIEKAILPVVVLQELAEEYGRRGTLPPLCEITTTGEQLQTTRAMADLLRRLPGCAFHNHYGPSESHVATAYTLPGDPDLWTTHPSVGWPIANTRIHLLEPTLAPVPIGVPGELYIAGVCLARGYVGRPALTAERFLPDPFSGEPGGRLYRTGDKVRRLADGSLDFLGRFDHQVKIRGFRIELEEIESVLARHPAVRQTLVLTRESPSGDKQLVAYVVADPLATAGPSWRDFLKERLPDYMVPAHFVALESLPLTTNGKVDRHALPDPEQERSGTPYTAPRNPLEELLSGIWSDLLGLARVGVHDDFFEAGGHSLLATRLTSRLRSALQLEIPLRDLFEEPTVEGLARRIRSRMQERHGTGEPSLPLLPLPRGLDAKGVPLSFAQRRLWFLHQLDPASPAYNMAVAVRFDSGLDFTALERSLGEVVRRHGALRTVFRAPAPGEAIAPAGEGAVQVVLPHTAPRLPVVDLAALPARLAQDEARRLSREEARRPFDLAHGPLLRVCLLRPDAAQSVLLATLHHIVSDGWSMRIVKSEVTSLYEAFQSGRPSPLPELPLQYADFAAWQRDWLQGEVLAAQLGYWTERLRGLPPPVPLPTAQPRRATSRAHGGLERLRLSEEIAAGVRSLSRAEGSTLFMVLLAAVQALLCRYTGQTDLCVGTPIAGRNRLETEGLIGCFLNTLALRADLAGDPTFRELLAQVREASLGAYAHQDLPFERLIEELQPERDLQRTPIFQVMFNLLNLEGVVASPELPLAEGGGEAAAGVKLDLSIYGLEKGGEIELLLHYDADLFEPFQMAVMAEHLRHLLASVATAPDLRLSAFALESIEARRLRIDEPATPAPSSWRAFTGSETAGSIVERFQDVVAACPERPAVVAARHAWTYRQLDRLSTEAAVRLLRQVGDSPRIALLCDQDAPRIAAVLAALKAGKTYVPLDPSYPRLRLAAVLRDAQVGGILTDEAQLELAAELAAGEVPVLRLALTEASKSPVEDLPAVAPGTPAYILYTSGSTGEPKGVVQSHRNVLHHIRAYTDALHLVPADRLSLLASYAFDAAVMDIFGALLNGAALYPFDVRREGTAALASWLSEQRITVYHSTPTLYRGLLAAAGERCFPSVRRVVLGGEKCVRQDLEQFRRHFPADSLFVNGLGPTESTLALQFFAAAGDAVDRGTVPVGHAVAGTEVALHNGVGEQAAVYGLGEIRIRSPYLALGYWRRPDLTAAAFLADPDGGERRIYRTGDLGRWLPDGSLEFVGRSDSQVKVRGHRVELGEIEAALSGLSGVREAVVVAREDEAGDDTRIAAYLLAADTVDLDPRRLRRELQQRLPDAMIPAAFVPVEAWPLTPTGKVDRAALPAPPAVRQQPAGETAAPRTPLEELLCGIWAEVLRSEWVGAHDDFFALGGHSLLATQLLVRIRQVAKVDIPLRIVFEASTVRQMAAWLEEELRTAEAAPRPALVPVPRQGRPFPLTFGQQRLWFLEQLQPGTAAYNLPTAVHLVGDLDAAALASAVTGVAKRHEILRTTFVDLDGEPVQVIHPAEAVALPEIDLGSLPAERRFAEARRLAQEEARRPFDLTRGPLFLVRLLRFAPREHALLASFHHIVTDGWSQGVFWRELAALYGSQRQHQPSPLPDLPVQYADFAHWQRRALSGEVVAGQLAYWRERLQGIPAQLELPFDRPRPAVPSFQGAGRPLSLPMHLGDQVRNLSRSHGLTPFMILLAAFQAVLGRHSGQEDICVGTPVAGRTQVEVEGLIGLFVNTLVMRCDLAGDPSFEELLRRTREAALQAYAHQDLPFERLVEELQPDRSLGLSPLFQVMLAFQNVQREAPRLDGAEIRSLAVSTGTVKFDLSLTAVETPDGLSGTLEYAAELFDAATVDRLLAHLRVLLEGSTRSPELRLSVLPLLSREERQQLLAEWADTADADPRDGLCLHELVLAQVRRTPDAEAVIAQHGRLTYRELERQSARLASRLTAAGVRPGAFVPVLLDGGAELVVALLAILRAGAAFVPLDPAWPEARRDAVLEELGEGILLVGDGSLPDLGPLPWRPMACSGGRESSPVVATAPAPAFPEMPIYAIYTSGSTGRPKGVVVPHRGIVNRFLWMDRYFGPGTAERVLQTTRPVYDSAVWQIFWPLIHGGATVLTPATASADPDALADLIAEHGITLTDFVPAVFELLVQQLRLSSPADARLTSLRALVVGGEEMATAAAQTFLLLLPHVRLVNLYGPTEASIGCIYHQVEPADGRNRRVPIGRPISNVLPVILDRWGSLAPAGVTGELCLAGSCLAHGYLRDGGQTGGAFVPNPVPEVPHDRLYRTGDLARRLPDGRIDLLGRTDRQIKIRGLRIELGEIEAALRDHPRVAAAAVLAWQTGPAGGDRLLAACFAPRPGEPPAEAELAEFLRQRLPTYMIPPLLVRLESLPLTQGGKVDRQTLAGVVAQRWRPAATAGGAAPRTPVEDILAGMWAELLGRDRIGLEDDFFALGGHSLLAMRVASRIRRVFGIELPIRALFEAPTLSGLARRIEEAVRAGSLVAAPPLRPVPRGGKLPLSFAQQRLWFLDQLTPGAAIYQLFLPVLVEGALVPGALARSLNGVVRRHESLRTVFPEVDGAPFQAVVEDFTLALPLVDLRALPDDTGHAEALRLTAEEASRPFNLAHGPLLRAVLLRLAPQRHTVLLGVHHIVCDGWSLRILLQEVAALYQAFSEGEPVSLPELPVQYADFAVWQRDWMRGETLEQEIDYWRQRLAGSSAVLALPADRPRPAIQSFRGARLGVAFPANLVSRLGRIARGEGGTLFMALLTGLDALLLRYTGQARIAVGTPIANRNHAEVEGLIGNFASTLVLQATFAPELSFRGSLSRVREAALGAYTHQDLPFEVLVEALSPQRDLSYNPFFQVLFGLHNLPPAQVQEISSGVRLRPLGAPGTTARFDLALDLVEEAEGLRGALEYSTDLFDAATAERIAGHLDVLLEGAAADPESRLDQLPLLTPLERLQALSPGSGSWGEETAAGRCLHELFEGWVRRTPEAVALVCGAERLTYAELDLRANRLARLLRSLGAGPDVPVGICLERSSDMVAALLGILKAGGAYVPLDPGYPRQRLAWILGAAAVPLLVTRGRLAASLPQHGARVVDLDAGYLDAGEAGRPGPAPLPDNLAYVIFTSGSTGGPKGVQINHRSAVHLMETVRPLFAFGPRDVWTVVHSFSFDISVWETWNALTNGGRLVMVSQEVARSPVELAQLLLTEGVTVLNQTPAALRQLLESGGEAAGEALRGLRVLGCGGEALSRELVAEVLRHTGGLWNLYGPTESTVWAAAGLVALEDEGGTVSLGSPLPDNQLLVLDAGGQPVPVGVSGELCIAGAGLARGYRSSPGLTAEKFVPHPFARYRGERLYRTGDLVRRRGNGALEFLGRIDHQVKVRGFRIELGEIEEALAEHPAVRQAVVTAPETGPGERSLVAHLVAAEQAPLVIEDLRRFVAARLPAYMIPSLFLAHDRLPLTPNGKVDRRVLAEIEEKRTAEDHIASATAHQPPRDSLELRLAEIWESLLPGRRVGVTDDWFALGGHSLLAVRLLARLRRELGASLPLSALFQHPTVESLAAALRGSQATPARPVLVEIQPGAARRPLFLVHPIGGNVLCYSELARRLGPDQPVFGLQTPEPDGEPPNLEWLAQRYVEAVRSVQPRGPYALGGWSLGGLIAFEMARRLRESGEPCEPVVLIDSLAPRAERPAAGDPVADFVRDFARSSGLEGEPPVAATAGEPEERLRVVYDQGLAAGLLPADLGFGEICRLFALFQFNREAMHSHVAAPGPQHVVVFRAASVVRDVDSTLGWARLAGGVEARELPGDHYTILRRPAVDTLARQIGQLLDPRGTD